MIGMSIVCALLGAPWIIIKRVPVTWEMIFAVFLFCILIDAVRGIASNMAAENKCLKHFIKTEEIKCSFDFNYLSLATYLTIFGMFAVPYILFGGYFNGRPHNVFKLLRFIFYLTLADCIYQYAKNINMLCDLRESEQIKYIKESRRLDSIVMKKRGFFSR